MGWLANDIVSIQMKQTFLGKNVVNKLFYRISSVPVGTDILEIFDKISEALILSMITVQSERLFHDEQIYLNETNKVDIFTTSFGASGLVVGFEDLPSSNAFGGKKVVSSRLTRPGAIRLAGVTETSVDGNSIVTATIVALGAIGTELADTQVHVDSTGKEMILDPVVVGRLPDGSLDLTKVQEVQFVGTWRVTTQVSRK